MKIRFLHECRNAISGLLLLIFSYSLILPYSLFTPFSRQNEIVTTDQLYPVLAFSLANTFYIQLHKTNLVQGNILAFAVEMMSFSFQNQIQLFQLNPPKFPTKQHLTFSAKVPAYLKKCLLRI